MPKAKPCWLKTCGLLAPKRLPSSAPSPTPLPKEPQVLKAEARALLKEAGYPQAPSDTLWGFEENKSYLDDLEKLGITSVGHRRRLLDAIASLRVPPAPVETTIAAKIDAVRPLDRMEAHPAQAERRQITVLFCDLVGSTELSTRLDPEDMSELLRTYRGCCTDTIARWDGYIARYMGDGVLVYFGWPRSHEDDAERAVRAGLELVAAVGRLDLGEGMPLAARVGIATGQVVAGDRIGEGDAQEHNVVGDTPNLAARLQSLASPNAIVIAPETRRLLGRLFEFRDLGSLAVKGFARPVSACEVLRASAANSGCDDALSATLSEALATAIGSRCWPLLVEMKLPTRSRLPKYMSKQERTGN